jgi:hypothetical protein
MQNKPNVKYAKINLTSYMIRIYVHTGQLVIQTNKPKTNPIQSQTNPICRKAKIDAKCAYTKDYEEKCEYWHKKTKPIQTQFVERRNNERFCVERKLYDCYSDFLADFTTLRVPILHAPKGKWIKCFENLSVRYRLSDCI